MTKYESQVYTVNTYQQHAYEKMANLKNFEAIKQAFEQPEFFERITQTLPPEQAEKLTPEKVEQIRQAMQNVVFSEDAVSFESKMGLITLAITDRQEPKLVKLVGVNTPIDINLWVQFLPQDVYTTKMKVTIGVELNFFIRKMVEKHIKVAPDGIAQMLSYVLAMP